MDMIRCQGGEAIEVADAGNAKVWLVAPQPERNQRICEQLDR